MKEFICCRCKKVTPFRKAWGPKMATLKDIEKFWCDDCQEKATKTPEKIQGMKRTYILIDEVSEVK